MQHISVETVASLKKLVGELTPKAIERFKNATHVNLCGNYVKIINHDKYYTYQGLIDQINDQSCSTKIFHIDNYLLLNAITVKRYSSRWEVRLANGVYTKAPIGVGNFSPGVILLVGEQSSNPLNSPEQQPFCSDQGCSGWLNDLLDKHQIPENNLFWINALNSDGSIVDLRSLYNTLQPSKVIALGEVAKKHLMNQGVPHLHVAHPQYHKRFKSKLQYPLIEMLK